MRMRGIYNYEAKPQHKTGLGGKLSGINGECRQENCGKGEMSDPQLQPIILGSRWSLHTELLGSLVSL